MRLIDESSILFIDVVSIVGISFDQAASSSNEAARRQRPDTLASKRKDPVSAMATKAKSDNDRRARAPRSKDRKAEIVSAARELYEEKGLSRTTVQNITDKVGVTRSLFYNYFADKDAVTSAVIDSMIEDYLEAVNYWDQDREVGKIDEALLSAVRLIRLVLFEKNPIHKSLASEENAALYMNFANRVADHIANFIIRTTVQDYGKLHEIRIQHLYETFYILILGVTGYLRTHEDVDDAVIANVIAQTLYLDRV